MQSWPLPEQLEQAGEAGNNGSRTNLFVLLKAHFQRTVSPGYRNQLNSFVVNMEFPSFGLHLPYSLFTTWRCSWESEECVKRV